MTGFAVAAVLAVVALLAMARALPRRPRRRRVSAEEMLAEPRPGTLGHRLGAAVTIDLTDRPVEIALRPEGFGSYAHAKRRSLIRAIATTLADGGPVEDELDAATQVVETIIEHLSRGGGAT